MDPQTAGYGQTPGRYRAAPGRWALRTLTRTPTPHLPTPWDGLGNVKAIEKHLQIAPVYFTSCRCVCRLEIESHCTRTESLYESRNSNLPRSENNTRHLFISSHIYKLLSEEGSLFIMSTCACGRHHRKLGFHVSKLFYSEQSQPI